MRYPEGHISKNIEEKTEDVGHPEVVQVTHGLLEIERDFETDVVVETWFYWKPGRQRRPVVRLDGSAGLKFEIKWQKKGRRRVHAVINEEKDKVSLPNFITKR